jgi:hypothetical protein
MPGFHSQILLRLSGLYKRWPFWQRRRMAAVTNLEFKEFNLPRCRGIFCDYFARSKSLMALL